MTHVTHPIFVTHLTHDPFPAVICRTHAWCQNSYSTDRAILFKRLPLLRSVTRGL